MKYTIEGYVGMVAEESTRLPIRPRPFGMVWSALDMLRVSLNYAIVANEVALHVESVHGLRHECECERLYAEPSSSVSTLLPSFVEVALAIHHDDNDATIEALERFVHEVRRSLR